MVRLDSQPVLLKLLRIGLGFCHLHSKCCNRHTRLPEKSFLLLRMISQLFFLLAKKNGEKVLNLYANGVDGDLFLISSSMSSLQKTETYFPLLTNGTLQNGSLRQTFPSSSSSSSSSFFLLLIIKRDLTCCVNASITFDTIISDLSPRVKLSAEVPGQRSLIRKRVSLPQVIKIQSVRVPPGTDSRKRN